MTNNVKAFLDLLAYAEIGYGLLAVSDNGYNCLVGSTAKHPLLFSDYSHHPRIYNQKMNSTASGRYQIIEGTYDYLSKGMGLKDFSPTTQDAMAIQLIKDKGALSLVENGEVEAAVHKIRNVWASMPGNSYNQPMKTIEELRKAFVKAGGVLL